MLFCEQPVALPPWLDATFEGEPHSKADQAFRSLALERELDELRGALAKMTGDYKAAVGNAAALREALDRADLRNKRSQCEAERNQQAAICARAELDQAREKSRNMAAELALCEAALQDREAVLRQQSARLEELHQYQAAATSQCSRQRAPAQELHISLCARSESGPLMQAAHSPRSGAFLENVVPAFRSNAAATTFRPAFMIAAVSRFLQIVHAARHEESEEDSIDVLLASGFFDATYYCAQMNASEAPQDRRHAARHYHQSGWRRYLDPSQRFSTIDYLLNHHDVAAAGIDPLTHYLQYGRPEGRKIVPAPFHPSAPPSRAIPLAPSEEEWRRLASRGAPLESGPALVDIIVPVFKGVAETLRCLYSVLSAPTKTPYRLVVVDDRTPEKAIAARLAWLARRHLIHLVRMPQNSGFVRACNAGMSLAGNRDILLLNSDTEVYGDWLGRLRRLAYRDTGIGTVTPFSNNAEICSYPTVCHDNPFRIELSDGELDAVMASENADGCVDIPTGVGFCMFIRHACLEQVGLLDADTFGVGYGEENDFCQRAATLGWRNVLAPNVFVRHYGGSSFGASKAARVQAAIAAVEHKHPGYLERIARFIEADPVAPWRARVDAVRMRRRVADRSAMLFVGHNRGGGTERHLLDMQKLLEGSGVPVLIGRPDPKDARRLLIGDAQLRFQPNMVSYHLDESPEKLATALRALGITHVHLHHLAGFADFAADYLRLACRAAGVSYDFTAHDYLCICPRITMTDQEGLYCGEPDDTGCRDCLRNRGSEFGSPAIWEWRKRYARLLSQARRVFVPADDVGQRLARYYSDVTFVTRPHIGGSHEQASGKAIAPCSGVVRHVGLIGAIGPHKGSDFFLRCAKRAGERNDPLRFTLLGYTDRDEAFAGCDNVTIEGAYAEADLASRLAELAPDILWFTALWPETFSYTLSAAFAAGILPIAFDFGAIAERIRQTGFGRLLPVDLMFDVDATLEALLHAKPSSARLAPEDPVTYEAPLRSYYGLAGAEGPNVSNEVTA